MAKFIGLISRLDVGQIFFFEKPLKWSLHHFSFKFDVWDNAPSYANTQLFPNVTVPTL